MTKNKKNESETIANSNFFIMDRPDLKNKGSLVIKTAAFHKEMSEKEELVQEALYDIVLNLSGRLTTEDHTAALRIVTPIFALHLYSEHYEHAAELINNFYESFPDKASIAFVKGINEEVSQLEAVVRINFGMFIGEKNKSLTKSLEKFEDFISDIETLMEQLPICYSFNLIDHLTTCEEKYKKEKSKKHRKT